MSDTEVFGELYNNIKKSGVTEKQHVNEFTQISMCSNVDITAHDALNILISNYGVSYGTNVIFNVCDDDKSVPALDFAAFLPISRYSAPKTYGEYGRLIRGQLKRCNYAGVVVTMAIDQTSHELKYYSKLSASDYFDCLYNWSTRCSAEFLLTDDEKSFYSLVTPSLRQIAAYAFGSETDGVVSADECILGDVCVLIAKNILEKMPIDSEITKALNERNMRNLFNESNMNRLCSIFNAVKRYNASFDVYI